MNDKEKAVLIFLGVVFLVGGVINIYKKIALQHRIASFPLIVNHPVDSSTERVLVDINSATAEQLDIIPGIGPVLAQRIISYREKQGGFNNISDLRKVPGIGPKRFETIKDWVTCRKPRRDYYLPKPQ